MVRQVHKIFKLSHKKVFEQLPKQYLDYYEKSRTPAERVVDEAPETKFLDYNQDHDTGYVYRVPDQPIDVIRNEQTDRGLWGGLGMVEGFYKPKKLRPRDPRVWWPSVERHTFYSDILEVHINVEVTDRTLELIDKHKGFDNYILQTSVQDLGSEFGRRLQHKMLLKLSTDNREYIKEKYKDYIRPKEEVEWHGLEIHEAVARQMAMRVDETIEPPLKVKFAQELIAKLKS